MSNTYKPSFLRAASAAFLMFGTAVLVAAHAELYLGSVTASLPMGMPYQAQVMFDSTQVPGVQDPDMVEMVRKQVLAGMLIVVAGFALHLLFRKREQNQAGALGEKGPRGYIRPAYIMK